MSASFDIRDAVAADAEGIAAIYNHAVLHTTAIWIDTPVDVANRAAWLAGVQRQGYPVLVAADAAGAVLGYAAFVDWRPFDGDSHTVEHSIYIRHDARGRGVAQGDERLDELLVDLGRCRIDGGSLPEKRDGGRRARRRVRLVKKTEALCIERQGLCELGIGSRDVMGLEPPGQP